VQQAAKAPLQVDLPAAKVPLQVDLPAAKVPAELEVPAAKAPATRYFVEQFTSDPATATGYADRVRLFTNAADARLLTGAGEDLRQRLDQLEKELKAVRAALDRIGEALKTDKPPKPE